MDNEYDVLAILFGIIAIVWLISLIMFVLEVIGQWKMFKKAGKEGWPALIPIYNTFVLCEVTGINPIWLIIVIVGSVVGGIIPVVGPIIIGFASIYFRVILAIATARSYGKSDAFAVGLFFLSPIFSLILGFGSSQYVGAKPPKDVVFEFFGIDNKNDSVTEATVVNETNNVNSGFCKNCGAKVTMNDSKFCTSCGKEL